MFILVDMGAGFSDYLCKEWGWELFCDEKKASVKQYKIPNYIPREYADPLQLVREYEEKHGKRQHGGRKHKSKRHTRRRKHTCR